MDMTTHEAAVYLAGQGYKVKSRRDGTELSPSADTIKHWCIRGKFQGARKSGRVWLIPKNEVELLVNSELKRKDYSDITHF
jgi:hypothetical protein